MKSALKIVTALDKAAAAAKTNPKEGVAKVVQMLNTAHISGFSVQDIMDAATARGFHCEFWPTGIRVTWKRK